MSLKLRNAAKDASVTLVDGGPIGSPSITLDVRDILHVDSNHAGRRWNAIAEYKAGDLVTKPHLFAGGFELDEYFVAQVDNNIGNDPTTDKINWKDANLVRYIASNIEFTVGVGGDFAKLDEAFLYVSRFSMVDGAITTFTILAGHVIDYSFDLIGLNIANNPIIKTQGAPLEIIVSGTTLPFISIDESSSIQFDCDINISGTTDYNNPSGTVVFNIPSVSFINSSIDVSLNGSNILYVGILTCDNLIGITFTVDTNLRDLVVGASKITNCNFSGAMSHAASSVFSIESLRDTYMNTNTSTVTCFNTFIIKNLARCFMYASNFSGGTNCDYNMSGGGILSKNTCTGKNTTQSATLGGGIIFER